MDIRPVPGIARCPTTATAVRKLRPARARWSHANEKEASQLGSRVGVAAGVPTPPAVSRYAQGELCPTLLDSVGLMRPLRRWRVRRRGSHALRSRTVSGSWRREGGVPRNPTGSTPGSAGIDDTGRRNESAHQNRQAGKRLAGRRQSKFATGPA